MPYQVNLHFQERENQDLLGPAEFNSAKILYYLIIIYQNNYWTNRNGRWEEFRPSFDLRLSWLSSKNWVQIVIGFNKISYNLSLVWLHVGHMNVTSFVAVGTCFFSAICFKSFKKTCSTCFIGFDIPCNAIIDKEGRKFWAVVGRYIHVYIFLFGGNTTAKGSLEWEDYKVKVNKIITTMRQYMYCNCQGKSRMGRLQSQSEQITTLRQYMYVKHKTINPS